MTTDILTVAVVIAGIALIYYVFPHSPKPANMHDDTTASVTPPAGDAASAPQTPPSPAATEPAFIIKNGVNIQTLAQGSGPAAKAGDKVSVHYTGMLTDGKVFDSSIPRGKPFTLTLGAGQVIAGWEVGLEGMQVGEKRKLTIPPNMGYGAQGAGGVIPPNATLVFEVELLAINGS